MKQWDESKIANGEAYTLNKQISEALQRTLLCHGAIIEDLLADGFDFVLTSRFQCDSIERRCGQYRLLNEGRFLVSLKYVTLSEKILKKSLVKQGMKIDVTVKLTASHYFEVQEMLEKFKPSVFHLMCY